MSKSIAFTGEAEALREAREYLIMMGYESIGAYEMNPFGALLLFRNLNLIVSCPWVFTHDKFQEFPLTETNYKQVVEEAVK